MMTETNANVSDNNSNSNRLCSRMDSLPCPTETMEKLSEVKVKNHGVGDFLVKSKTEAYDFDKYAASFANEHNLGSRGERRTPCSPDAVHLDKMNDIVYFIEFKNDSVGEFKDNQFVFNRNGNKNNRGEDYELQIYRKFVEAFIMLMADGHLTFDDGRESVVCMLVVKQGKNSNDRVMRLDRFARRVRNIQQFSILKPLSGFLFNNVTVVTDRVFDSNTIQQMLKGIIK
ncbi:hypothetical protein [uncultured Bifidobacterium sp.]|uniref:hypothetical protein n=1 Tax=uncultured Bifidobacterium sp. TaxID=165187 RepID=UPI002609EDF7|nr:hypothetical protein [uncultured Bifidobacterium sp.]